MHIMTVGLVHNCACAEEGADFHYRMEYQMRQRAHKSQRRHNDCAEKDVGQIADGGVCQPPFEVRFFHGTAAAVYDGKRPQNIIRNR